MREGSAGHAWCAPEIPSRQPRGSPLPSASTVLGKKSKGIELVSVKIVEDGMPRLQSVTLVDQLRALDGTLRSLCFV